MKTLCCSLIAVLLLAACGQAGSLYLPDAQEKKPQAPPPAVAQPQAGAEPPPPAVAQPKNNSSPAPETP